MIKIKASVIRPSGFMSTFRLFDLEPSYTASLGFRFPLHKTEIAREYLPCRVFEWFQIELSRGIFLKSTDASLFHHSDFIVMEATTGLTYKILDDA